MILGRGEYTKLFDHMAFDHNFSVGQPDNLVYINELLDLLEGKLDNLVSCLPTLHSIIYNLLWAFIRASYSIYN